MRYSGRGILWSIAVIVACSGFAATDALAQSYPNKQIRIVLGFVAGGAVDFTARLVARKLSESLGQQVIVENLPGATGAIAIERAAKSPPDGYTLLMMASSGAVQAALNIKRPYDLERDLAPISLVAVGASLLIVHPSVPARSVKELIALAQARPGTLSYGSAGIGSGAHLAGELFKLMAKVNIVHVPYKGGAESAIAAAAGQIEMSITDFTSARPFVENGKVRALATIGGKRLSSMPAIPTLDESGLRGYDRASWFGVLAPAGTPRDIIARLNGVLEREFNSAEVKALLAKQGLDPQTGTPEAFAALIHHDLVENAQLIKLSGATAE